MSTENDTNDINDTDEVVSATNDAAKLAVPDHLEYSDDHVWIDADDDPALLGITDYAANQLGEIVFVDFPQVGDHFNAGDELLQLESAKSIEPVITPVAGTVKYINAEVEQDASVINDDPYGEGWLVKIELEDDEPELLTAEQYEKIISKHAAK